MITPRLKMKLEQCADKLEYLFAQRHVNIVVKGGALYSVGRYIVFDINTYLPPNDDFQAELARQLGFARVHISGNQILAYLTESLE